MWAWLERSRWLPLATSFSALCCPALELNLSSLLPRFLFQDLFAQEGAGGTDASGNAILKVRLALAGRSPGTQSTLEARLLRSTPPAPRPRAPDLVARRPRLAAPKNAGQSSKQGLLVTAAQPPFCTHP